VTLPTFDEPLKQPDEQQRTTAAAIQMNFEKMFFMFAILEQVVSEMKAKKKRRRTPLEAKLIRSPE